MMHVHRYSFTVRLRITNTGNNTYLGETLSGLTQSGSPHPPSNTKDVYMARRKGSKTKEGAMIVINNSNVTKGLWVDATPDGWSNRNNKLLMNVFDSHKTTQIDDKGRVWMEAPARSYNISVTNNDYLPYKDH